MVLHTWGQRLQHHPHVHCVVPDGRLGAGRHPVDPRPSALLPPDPGAAETLSRQARGRPATAAFREGRLDFPGILAPLKPEAAFRAFLRSLYRQTWVVYAKPPFGSPAHVLHYLARYTHRVAISNHRLVDVTDDTVSFRWKDYRHGSQVRTLTLAVDEFLRRFLLHVLPKRFVRIRYFGFLASRCRTPQLAQCRQALAVAPAPPLEPTPPARPRATWPCPRVAAPCASSSASRHGNSVSRRSSPTSSMTRRSSTPRPARRSGVALVRAARRRSARRVCTNVHDRVVPRAVRATSAALRRRHRVVRPITRGPYD